MLDLYRFVSMDDVEDVLLLDRSKYAVYDEGQWLSPVGDAAQHWTMSSSASVSTDSATRLAKMLWMEKDRTDARAVGKMTVIRGGGIRGKTDVFVAADFPDASDPVSFVGKELTLKLDTDGVVKLGIAAPGNVVKALVFQAPHYDGLLHFELVD